MKREKLIRSKGYNVSKIQNELYRQLTEYLETNEMTRSAFAKQLGVSKGYISQVLNGDFDYKISKLVELSLAIGKVPVINFESFENIESKKTNQMKVVHMEPLKYKNSSSSVSLQNAEFEQFDLKKA
ncbi:helix-turn-helix domain-containing protein [Labilibaculum sp.]|uniref:helix-turn-helix domain-containing protein n=1 Tax=Labilibaculum sp. TaxID=2060723 RepID=UPI00356A70F6